MNVKLHKNIMIQILKDIYSDISVASVLGFKGGTTLYLFYDLPRFSVDLDFDLLDGAKKKTVFEKMATVLEMYGQLKDKREKYYNLFFLLSYKAGESKIKVEISKRTFGSSYELKNYLGIPMLVMKRPDMFAHKLVTLLERKEPANRDIFDIWFMLKNNFEVNWEIVEKRTGQKKGAYIRKCIQFLEKLAGTKILAGMGELVDEKTKTWAKENLLRDTVFFLKLRLESGI